MQHNCKTWLRLALVFSAFYAWVGAARALSEPGSVASSGHILIPAGSGAFDPEHQVAVTLSDSSGTIRLIKQPTGLLLEIRNTQNRTSRLALPWDIAQVDQIGRAAGDKAVVLGTVDGSVGKVVVVDRGTSSIVDQFWCYFPSLSPDGRFIAFVKFFPRHDAGNSEAHYMLHDLRLGPAANRPQGAKQFDPVQVGVALYPEGKSNTDGDNLQVPAGADHHAISDVFYWSDRGGRLFFGDGVGESESLLMATFDEQTGTPTMWSLPISREQLCSDVTGAWCDLRLTALGVDDAGVSATITGRSARLRGSRQQVIPFTDFRRLGR